MQSFTRLAFPIFTALVISGTGCGDGTGPDDPPRVVSYQFALAAFGGDTTSERARNYECLVYGFFELPRPAPASGTVRFPVQIERRFVERRGAHIEFTEADSTVTEAELVYAGLGGANLDLALAAGPYEEDLGQGVLAAAPPPEYGGEWTCGPAVPLAQDSTLLAYGYDPTLRIAGTWRMSELQPVE